jgi:hypothetical protein
MSTLQVDMPPTDLFSTLEASMPALDGDNLTGMAALMDELGEPGFPEKLLETLRAIAGTDFCSAFQAEEDGSLTYLFACGYHSTIPGFAERASLDYARRYWLRDRVTRQMLNGRPLDLPRCRSCARPGTASATPNTAATVMNAPMCSNA